jgi:hypothetical protein
MAMTKRDYVWLAKVFAVLSYRWMATDMQREAAYDYFIERLEIKHADLDPKKFREAYEEQLVMLR